jgi:hypothetical protein
LAVDGLQTPMHEDVCTANDRSMFGARTSVADTPEI